MASPDRVCPRYVREHSPTTVCHPGPVHGGSVISHHVSYDQKGMCAENGRDIELQQEDRNIGELAHNMEVSDMA